MPRLPGPDKQSPDPPQIERHRRTQITLSHLLDTGGATFAVLRRYHRDARIPASLAHYEDANADARGCSGYCGGFAGKALGLVTKIRGRARGLHFGDATGA